MVARIREVQVKAMGNTLSTIETEALVGTLKGNKTILTKKVDTLAVQRKRLFSTH